MSAAVSVIFIVVPPPSASRMDDRRWARGRVWKFLRRRVARPHRAHVTVLDLRIVWQLRRVPAAAQRLQQGDAGDEAVLQEAESGLPIAEGNGLRGDAI